MPCDQWLRIALHVVTKQTLVTPLLLLAAMRTSARHQRPLPRHLQDELIVGRVVDGATGAHRPASSSPLTQRFFLEYSASRGLNAASAARLLWVNWPIHFRRLTPGLTSPRYPTQMHRLCRRRLSTGRRARLHPRLRGELVGGPAPHRAIRARRAHGPPGRAPPVPDRDHGCLTPGRSSTRPSPSAASTTGCSDRSWSTWAARSMAESTSLGTRPPTLKAGATMSWISFESSG